MELRNGCPILWKPHVHEIRLGCSTVSHKNFGWCCHCSGHHPMDEVNAWRLRALEEARQWCAQHCVGVFAPPLHRHSCPMGRD